MRDFHIAAVTVGATQINQIEDQSVDPRVEEAIMGYDGQVDPTAAWIMALRSTIGFSTSALKLAIDAITLGGLAVTTAGDPIDFYFQPSVQGGTRDTTDCTHFSGSDGIVCIDSIDADEGRPASLAASYYSVSPDGTTAPLTVASGATMPAEVATRQAWTVGPVKINGTLFEGTKSLSFRPNKQVEQGIYDGHGYPTHAYLLSRQPVFTIRTANIEAVADLGLFTAQGATDSVLYLRRLAQNNLRVANGTAQHIGFTIDDGLVIARRVGGSHGRPAMAEIEFPCVFDGTNAIVAINTATAIS